MRINSNIPALTAQRTLGSTALALSRSLARLSSGRRINESRDDAAGLAISERLSSQVRGLRQIALNINQAFGYLQTADGILSTQVDLVQRMKELAVQASNGTLSNESRQMMEAELLALVSEFERVAEQANFNGSKLLDGSFGTLSLQVGLQKGETIDFDLQDSRGSAIFTSVATIGTGTFSQNQTFALTDSPSDFSYVGDIDGDGDTDFTVSEFNGTDVYLYRQNEDGGYSQELINSTADFLTFGDLNGDALVDFVEYDGSESRVRIQNQDGSFQLAQTLTLDTVSLVDFDSDGDLDIVHDGVTSPHVALNSGGGSFSESTAGSFSVAMDVDADINGDGILDAVAIQGINNRVVYSLGSGNGSFGVVQTLNLGAGYTSIRLADFTGDGIQDVVGLHSTNGNAVIQTGSSTGAFTAQPTLTSAANYSNLVEAEDINGDGREDLVFVNTTGNSAAVRLSNGDGTFVTGATFTVPAGTFNSAYINYDAFVDLDGDGSTDFVSYAPDSISVFWGDGLGSFSFGQSLALDASYPPRFMDMNHDGRMDIISGSSGTAVAYASLQFVVNRGGRELELASVDTSYLNVASGDLNGDGALDYLLSEDGGSSQTQFFAYLQNTSVVEEGLRIRMRTQQEAQDLLEVFDRAIEKLSERRSTIGATVSRLESAFSTTAILGENISAARSQMMDADIAYETAELVKYQILQQAQASVLGQANASLALALQLLDSSRPR